MAEPTRRFVFYVSKAEGRMLDALEKHDLRTSSNWLRFAIRSTHDGRNKIPLDDPSSLEGSARDREVTVRLTKDERKMFKELAGKLAGTRWMRLKIRSEHAAYFGRTASDAPKAKRAAAKPAAAKASPAKGRAPAKKPAAKKPAAKAKARAKR